MGVEREVPKLEIPFPHILYEQAFDGSDLLLGRFLIGSNEVVEQLIDATDVSGHTMFQHIVSVGLMA